MSDRVLRQADARIQQLQHALDHRESLDARVARERREEVLELRGRLGGLAEQLDELLLHFALKPTRDWDGLRREARRLVTGELT